MEATRMPADRRMDEDAVAQTHRGILLSHKSECVWVSYEVSQKENDKYRILIIYMEFRKMALMNLFAGQQWTNRHREHTYGLRERGGEGEMYGESNMETYIIICKIDSQ